ncbi:MAG: hypothetical protein NTW66_03000 [Candidatus Magasanikbacteria bacterium]|nr:hypothetical protein [Candidatus Magasanikbacteria bacterium]
MKNFRLTDIRSGQLVSNGLVRAVSAEAASRNFALIKFRDESLMVFFRADEVDMMGVNIENACPECGLSDPNIGDEFPCPNCT